MDSTPLLQRARLLLETRRPADAQREARAGLALEPDNRELLHTLCSALARQKKLKEARTTAESLVAVAPDWVDAHLIACYIEIEAGRYNAAEKSAREALRLAPDTVAPHQNLSVCFANQGQWADALREAEAGLSIDSEHIACLNMRTRALGRLGRREESRTASELALRLEPNNARAQYAAGMASLMQSRAADAIGYFSEALRLDPTNNEFRAALVQALKARNIIYRSLLVFAFWQLKLPKAARTMIRLGLFALAWSFESLRNTQIPVLNQVGALPWVVLLLVFFRSGELLDMVLVFDKQARHALSDKQRRNAIILIVIIAAIALVAVLAWIYFSFIHP